MTLLYHLWHSKWKLEKSVVLCHYLPDHPKCSSPMFFDDRTASRQYFVQHAGENAAFELGSCSWGRSVQSQERCGLKLTYIPTFTGFQSGEYWSRNMPIILFQSFTDAVIQERRHTLPSEGTDDFLKAKAKTKTLDFIDVLLLTKVGSSGIWV